MPKVKVRRGALTIPATIRAALDVRDGDEIEVSNEGGRIVLTPSEPFHRDAEAEAAIAEGLADAGAGRLSPPFQTAEEIERWQESKDFKKFIGKA